MRATKSPKAAKSAEITPITPPEPTEETPPIETPESEAVADTSAEITASDKDTAPTETDAPAEAEPETAPEAPAEPQSALPTDAASWRTTIPTLPPRDLLRIVTRDKMASARIFAGFRASADMLRNPVVVQRLAEAAVKSPKFAEMLGDLVKLVPPVSGSLTPLPRVSMLHMDDLSQAKEGESETSSLVSNPAKDRTTTDPNASTPDSPLSLAREGQGVSDREVVAAEDPRLRDKLKEQRNALRDKDARIAALEAALTQAQRERDTARGEAETARASQRASEAEAERQRRLRDREDRRETQQAAKAEAAAVTKAAAAPTPAMVVTPQVVASARGRLIEAGMQRLLTRGRYAIVADICREALALEGESEVTASDRGHLRALYAQSLYGTGEAGSGEEQDRSAAGHLIDAGELVRAAEALGRVVTYAPNLRPAGLTPTFKRLFALAEKMGQTEAVNDVLTHVRIGSAEANRRLNDALSGGDSSGRRGSVIRRTGSEQSSLIGPDEPIALPTRNADVATVTARGIVEAVDSGDAVYLVRAANGLRALQARGETADKVAARALLFAVAALDPIAVQALTQLNRQVVVVDASNVARHNPDPLAVHNGTSAQVVHLHRMRDFLIGRGFFPIVMIADANLRFHINDRAAYQSLLERGVVRETPPGTSADEELIAEARHRDAPLVTNDRLAEWGQKAAGIDRLNFVLLANGVSLTPI